MRMIFLILAVAIAGQMRAETVIETAPRPVRFTTRDSIELAATYYHPISSNPVPAVILLHSYGKNSEEWGAVASLFQMNQVAALALDLRGHGASTHRLTANGTETVDYHNFTPQDYTAMLLDINQAYDWLASQPGIDKHRIAVVGSSIGANLGLRYAAFNDEVVGLVLISPGLFYQNLRTDDVITGYGKRPLRIVVSRDDTFAFASALQLIEIRQRAGQAVESNETIVCSGSLHGATMLTGVKDLSGVVFGWLNQLLSSLPASPAEPAPKGIKSNYNR